MKQKRILVINPNSNETVTAALRKSLAGFSADAKIDCCTLDDGPFGIESDEDITTVTPLVVRKIAGSPEYDAFVIACYSDPGLAECRALCSQPVFGMQQSAVETAVSYGGEFGVIALSDVSIARHLAYIRDLGYADNLAAELPLDISVDDTANDAGTFDKVLSAGRRLVDEFNVTSIILGCAGMAAIRERAQEKLPVPVIEPAQAAVRLAIESN